MGRGGGIGRVSTEVELNRRRWKSIGRLPSNNSHATSIVATCSLVRSYKISLRAWGNSERRKPAGKVKKNRNEMRTKNEEQAKEEKHEKVGERK